MTDRAQEIFEQIIDRSTEDQRGILDELCADDAQLRNLVEDLLTAHHGAGRFLGDPTISHLAAYSEPDEQAGATIGRYKLLEKIGQGGFGDVYMAQQFEPVNRRVAIKIIKLGMDTKQVIARFEAERQALALMDHPNIAQVLDGGETASGRPYFVMELVRGEPITNYCDREKLTPPQRLKIFQQVCRAIQHAHQKGIIHRDIKPGNVLVTIADGKPLVKVIDFGIAKATNTELTEKTLFTEFRQLIGTPQYMSPEQAERSGVDIDTRSDIYALGILLYEMLTGQTPVDPTAMKSAVWGELQRMICEEEPKRPSTLVSSLGQDSELRAKARGTEPMRLKHVLRGDLDWIVLKALEKDRTRRYGAASELSDDVQRYLDDQPVVATPPSAGYLLRKLIRRNKTAIVAGSLLAISLMLGLIATSFTSIWAMHERDKAKLAEQTARDASIRAEQLAARASRMLALSGNTSDSSTETDELVQAWLSDIEDFKSVGERSETDILTQECQLAVWWHHHGGGSEAARMIKRIYPRAREVLGLNSPNLSSLVNANLLANWNEFDPKQIADLFTDLVDSARLLKSDEFESLLPQLAAALHKAERDEEATEAIHQYLAFRHGSRPNPAKLALEKIRLRGALRDLTDWSAKHPELTKQLEDYQDTLPEMTAN